MVNFEVKQTGAVAEVFLNGVHLLGRHDEAAALELRDIMFDLGDDDAVKLIMLVGGDDFAPRVQVPADGVTLHQAATTRYSAFVTGSGLFQQVCYCKKPVVAVVSGECAGAGALLALYSDLTIASSEAQFWPPFATVPEANFAYAAFAMRLNRAKTWALRGVPLSADQALQYGLVNWVVEPAKLRARAMEIGQEIVKRPLDGLTSSKAAFESFIDSRGVDADFEIGAVFAQGAAVSGRS